MRFPGAALRTEATWFEPSAGEPASSEPEPTVAFGSRATPARCVRSFESFCGSFDFTTTVPESPAGGRGRSFFTTSPASHPYALNHRVASAPVGMGAKSWVFNSQPERLALPVVTLARVYQVDFEGIFPVTT
jgi:hypothetical protein